MAGVVMGHGSYDGTDMITVPKGLPMEFFTVEESPLLFINLLELIKGDNPRRPVQTLTAGSPVPNYHYDVLKPHELTAVTTFNQLTDPNIVVGAAAHPTAIRLCEDKGHCPTDGPHTCRGVFGLAAKWTKLQVVSCRILRNANRPAPKAILDAHGQPTTAAFDALQAWVHGFVAAGPAAQDARWRALTDTERIRYAAGDLEISEWADCLAIRTRMAADPGHALDVFDATSENHQIRLMRDYSAVREVLRPEITLVPAEVQAIASFRSAALPAQCAHWVGLTAAEQIRWLTDPGMASWAAGHTALEMFRYGLHGERLAELLRTLDPVARAVPLADPEVTAHLTKAGIHL
jgi:hypothetical protein